MPNYKGASIVTLIVTIVLIGAIAFYVANTFVFKKESEAGPTATPSPSPTRTPTTISIPKETALTSLQLSTKKFIRDSNGVPITSMIVGQVKIEGKEQVSYSCRAAYSDQLVERAITQIGQSGDNPFTILASATGRLDIGKWGACCDLGSSLDEKTTSTICEDVKS